jgi:hypothetical protein
MALLVGLPDRWWKNEEFSPVDIISPLLFMLICHLRYEQ